MKIPYEKTLKLSDAPTARIACHLWPENNYAPETDLTLCYNQSALRVRLRAAEPVVTIVAREDNGRVWEDSCLELFLAPYEDDPDYLNLECKAAGAMIIGKGPNRENRVSVVEQIKPLMDVNVTVRPGKDWEVNYVLPFSMLEDLFGKPFAPEAGKKMRFNADLCGDKTPQPHYLAVFPIDVAEPDFHRPEYFGEAVFGQ